MQKNDVLTTLTVSLAITDMSAFKQFARAQGLPVLDRAITANEIEALLCSCLVNPVVPPAEAGFELPQSARCAVRTVRDIQFELDAHVFDTEALMEQAALAWSSANGDIGRFEMTVPQALYELLVADAAAYRASGLECRING